MNDYKEAIRIHKMLEEALGPIRHIQNQYSAIFESVRQAQEILDNFGTSYQIQHQLINENIFQITKTFTEMNQTFSEPYQQFFKNLLEWSESLAFTNSITSSAHDVFSTLTDGVSISSAGISITEEALQSVSKFVDLPPKALDSCSETSTKMMSFKEFLLNILLPILMMLIPMLQTQYLHSLDCLEAEQLQLKESEYQERLIQIEEERLENEQQLLTYLEQISESLKKIQADQQTLESSVSVLQQSLIESPATEESVGSVNEVVDVLDTHNEYE